MLHTLPKSVKVIMYQPSLRKDFPRELNTCLPSAYRGIQGSRLKPSPAGSDPPAGLHIPYYNSSPSPCQRKLSLFAGGFPPMRNPPPLCPLLYKCIRAQCYASVTNPQVPLTNERPHGKLLTVNQQTAHPAVLPGTDTGPASHGMCAGADKRVEDPRFAKEVRGLIKTVL